MGIAAVVVAGLVLVSMFGGNFQFRLLEIRHEAQAYEQRSESEAVYADGIADASSECCR